MYVKLVAIDKVLHCTAPEIDTTVGTEIVATAAIVTARTAIAIVTTPAAAIVATTTEAVAVSTTAAANSVMINKSKKCACDRK